jgi:biopolymer transport protein ExbD
VEINIVPLVDVALVLLIIFMVTATFAQNTGMRLQLPTAATAQVDESTPRDLTIAIDQRGRFIWQGEIVSDSQLLTHLTQEARAFGAEARITIQGDARAAHGRIVQALSLAQQAGFSRLLIATRPDTGRAERDQ